MDKLQKLLDRFSYQQSVELSGFLSEESFKPFLSGGFTATSSPEEQLNNVEHCLANVQPLFSKYKLMVESCHN